MTHDEVADLLHAQEWIYAKTMPQDPHWYTLRRNWTDSAAFTAVVRFIREHGVPEVYKGVTYRVLVIGEMKYWTMFASPEGTTLINRTYQDDARRWPEGRPSYA